MSNWQNPNVNVNMNSGRNNTMNTVMTMEDRQKVIQAVISQFNQGPFPGDAQKLAQTAQDLEKYVYDRTSTREDYLKLVKVKLAQIRQRFQAGQQQQQPQTQPQPQQPQQIQPTAQQIQFMQQQAQARNQTQQAQLQARQQQQQQQQQQQLNMNQQQQQPQPQPQQQVPPQRTQQQLKLEQIVRSTPIPQNLLAKIPILPPGINQWPQVIELVQKKEIPPQYMPVIKEIYSAHTQLVQHEQQQQQKMNQMQRNITADSNNTINSPATMNTTNTGSTTNNNSGNMMMNQFASGGFNNITPQQREQMQRQLQKRSLQQQQQVQQQQVQQQQVQQQQQQQQLGQPQQQSPQLLQQQVPDVGPGPNQMQQQQMKQLPQIQITQQDYISFTPKALKVLADLEAKGQIKAPLDQMKKDAFIKRYILHQKMAIMKQQQEAQQQMQQTQKQPPPQQQLQQQMSQQHSAVPLQQPQPIQPMLQQQQQQQQQPPPPLQQQQVPVQQSPMLSNIKTPMMKPNQQTPMANTLSSPLMPQRGPTAPVTGPPQVPPPQQQQQPIGQLQLGPGGLVLTDEIKLQLKRLFNEVASHEIMPKDVTNQLSPQQKDQVRSIMTEIQQQYSNVDTIISYLHVIGRNDDITRRLIQMKFTTKKIFENLRNGIYLCRPEMLSKLSEQYAKYFNYVINARKQQVQQAQQQQRQGGGPLPQQQQPTLAMQNQMNVQQQQQQQQQQHQQQPGQFMGQNQQIPPQQVNMGNNNNWNTAATVNANAQAKTYSMQATIPRQSISTSPLMPSQMSVPMQMQVPVPQQGIPQPPPSSAPPQVQQQQQQQQQIPHQILPPSAPPQIPQQQQLKGRQPSKTGPSPVASGTVPPTKKTAGGQGRKKKQSISAAPTPAAVAPSVTSAPPMTVPTPTPGSLANAIKTPNYNIATPQIPQSQSNKNTPAGQSPNVRTTSNAGSTLVFVDASVDLFAMIQSDPKVARRKELSNNDPTKFFYASLANLLELDESIIDENTKKARSPLSPVIATTSSKGNNGSWTCEIKPQAITGSFRQVGLIRELVDDDDIIGRCEEMAIKEEFGVKREFETEDLDLLFTEKRPRIEDSIKKESNGDVIDDYKFIHEPVAFDDWKDFIISSIQ